MADNTERMRVLDEEMRQYLEDVEKYGAAYLPSEGFLQLYKQGIPLHDKLGKPDNSPCGAISLFRTGNTIIGVRFHMAAGFLRQRNLSARDIKGGVELLMLYTLRIEERVEAAYQKTPWLISAHTQKAARMFEAARLFFKEHPDAATIPDPVRDRWELAFKTTVH